MPTYDEMIAWLTRYLYIFSMEEGEAPAPVPAGGAAPKIKLDSDNKKNYPANSSVRHLQTRFAHHRLSALQQFDGTK